MAQYFRPRRAASSSATSDGHGNLPSINRWQQNRRDVELNNQMDSSSILIFPSPPSEQESSRSVSDSHFELSESLPSLPTDVSLDSVRSASRSRSRAAQGRRRRGSESWQNVPHGWDETPLEELSEWEMDSAYVRLDHPKYPAWSYGRSGEHTRTHSASSLNSPFSYSLTLSPEPPFRLPLISFIKNVLTLDESTLHLVSRSPDPYNPVLFPVSPGPPLSPMDVEEEPPRGELRLLLHHPDKSKNTALIKAGMDPSEIPSDVNPFLPGRISVWRLVEFVIEGGVRAWREVKTWEAAEARLIGV